MASNSEWLAHKLHTLEQQVQSLSRGTGLGHSSLHGGTISALDNDGLPVAEFGSDGGGGGVLHLDGPVPPVPSAPVLEQGIGTIFVRWDGLYASEEDGVPVEAPIDFDRIEVHATTDPELDVWDEDTLAGSITQRGGGVVMIRGWEIDDVVYVRLVCRSLADKVSAASAPAEVTVTGIDLAAIVEELDAANVELANLDGTMFAANAELDALRIQFKNLDTSIINTDDGTLSEALNDARQSLEDVRGQANANREALGDLEGTVEQRFTDADTAIDGLRDSLTNLDETTLPGLRQDLDAAEDRLDTAEGAIIEAFDDLEELPRTRYGTTEPTHDAPDGSAYYQIDDTATVTYAWAGEPHASESIKYIDGREVARNKVINGDFENGLEGWEPSRMTEASAIDFNREMWGGAGGVHRFRGRAEANEQYADIRQNCGPVAEGQWVGLSAFVATEQINTPLIRIQLTWYGDNGEIRYSQTEWTDRGQFYGGAWIHDALRSPFDAHDIRLQVQMEGTVGISGQRLWVDEVVAVFDDTGEDAFAHSAEYWDGDTPDGTTGGFDKIVAQWERRDGAWIQVPIRSEAIANLDVGKLTAGVGEIAEVVSQKVAAAVGQFLELDVGQLTVTEQSKLADVVAEQIAADTAQFMELEVGKLVASEGILDEAVIKQLFAEVVVSQMSFADSFIGGNAILDGSVTADKVAANAIGARAIAADAIEAGKIAAGAITARELAANSVNAEKIVGLSITADELAANSVSTPKLLANAVTADKITANAVTTGKLDALAVTADKIASNAITADKIAANAITADKIDADAINGKTITGATVRTNETGARVELNAAGISSWNSLGTRTFNVARDTGQVEAVGSIFSGLPGQQRVVIDDQVYQDDLTIELPNGSVVPATGAGIIFGREGVSGASGKIGYRAAADGSTAITLVGPVSSSWGSANLHMFDNGQAVIQSGRSAGELRLLENGQVRMLSGGEGGGEVSTWPTGVDVKAPSGAEVRLFDSGTAYMQSGSRAKVAANSNGAVDVWARGSGTEVDIAHVSSSNNYTSRMVMAEDRIDTTAPTSIVYTTGSGGYLAVSGDSVGGFVRSTSVYNRTYSGAANVYVSSSGNLGRSTSARRYKVDEQVLDPAEYADALLSVPFKSWVDKGQLEQHAELEQFREANPMCPTPEWFAEAADGVDRPVGAVAEDFVDAGLSQFVTFDRYGRPDGLQYDRVGVALIPIIKGMKEQIDRLEAANGIGE